MDSSAGMADRGRALQGPVRRVEAWQARLGEAGQAGARQVSHGGVDTTRLSKAGNVSNGETRCDLARPRRLRITRLNQARFGRRLRARRDGTSLEGPGRHDYAGQLVDRNGMAVKALLGMDSVARTGGKAG